MTLPTLRDQLASLPARKALVRAVVKPIHVGKRHRTISTMYGRLQPGPDGRIHTGLSVATTSMRLASSESIVEEGSCLTGDAEVLTPWGWRRLDSLEGPTTVLQWSAEDGSLSWCQNAPLTRAVYDGDLIEADSWFHQLAYTANHRVPYRNVYDEAWREDRADRVSTYKTTLLPISGTYIGGVAKITEVEARLLAAFQADGSYFKDSKKAIRWQFKKTRKVTRLKKLLQSAGWVWRTTKAPPEYTRFYVPDRAALMERWLGRQKQLGPWLLSWPLPALQAFVEETQYWDATRRRRSWMYFTIHQANAEWVATAAHLVEYSASIRVIANRNPGSYGEHSAKPLYTVAIKPRGELYSEAKHYSRCHYRGLVYCVTTETSYFLVRRHQRICVTGNTNLQNQANKIAVIDPLYDTRAVMKADPGFQLVSRDFAGAEMLLAFAYSKDWEWVGRLLKGEKAHAIHAIEAFGLKCKPEEVKTKHANVYTTSKNLGFLSIYSGSARTAAVTFNKDYAIHGQRTTEKEVLRFQQVLYDLHPLQLWWAEVEAQIEMDHGVVTNCFGYSRPLRDPDVHNRLKDGLSFYPQSTVAVRMNQSIIEFHDTLDRQREIELLHQNHDELDWQSIPECLEESLRDSKRIMEQHFRIHGRDLYIPTEAKVSAIGGSWGDMHGVKD